MIFRSMEALNVYPPQAVIKIGDTVPDVQEGLNAGTWSVGVSHTGNDVGVDAEQFARLPDDERELLVARAEARLTEAGAHELITSVADVPAVVTRIEQRLAAGQKP